MSKKNGNGHRSSGGNGNGHAPSFDEIFGRWYRTHYGRIKAQCARLLRDDTAAEDVAQEALLRAWVRRDSIREEDVGAWLTVVARNLCVSALRRGWRAVPLEPMPEIADHLCDPALEAESEESRRSVIRAMEKLSDRHRRVIYLREVHGVEYEDMSSEMGLTPEGVRSIAFRARRVLREHLIAVGEGVSGIILGARVRFRSTITRARSSLGMVDGGTPAMQAGINLALVVGMTLTGPGLVAGAASAAQREPARPTAATAKASQSGLAFSVPVSSRPLAHIVAAPNAPKGSGGPTNIPKNTHVSLYNPDGSSSAEAPAGRYPLEATLHRGTPDGGEDGFEPVYAIIDPIYFGICDRDQRVCDALAGF